MPYQYQFDSTLVGDFDIPTEIYSELHSGLAALRKAAADWNQAVRREGGEPPYEREVAFLGQMVAFGSNELRGQPLTVRLRGLSVGSLRFLRAGIEFQERRLRAEIRTKREEGWPSGAILSLERRADSLGRIVDQISYEPAEILWEVLPQEESTQIVTQIRERREREPWDFFIAHASEDKDTLVRALAAALIEEGFNVWYDEFSLRLGDNLRRKIDQGLSQTQYGIVVLSPSFFAKEWPQRELDGLFAREAEGHKVILPIWHNVGEAEVRAYSPILVGRFAARSDQPLEQIVANLLSAMKEYAETGKRELGRQQDNSEDANGA